MKTKKVLKRALIMAGGTGGHIFPGLAVAQALKKANIEVHWMGTAHGLESRIIPEADIPLHLIKIHGLRGKGVIPLLTAPFKITGAILQAKRILKKVNPDIVIGMGGFVSGPGGIATWLTNIPLIIHEQNAKAGLTNKILAKCAQRVLEGFPHTFAPQDKVITVGNPVREDILLLPSPEKRLNQSPLFRVLVLGGSLGADILNKTLPKALAKLADEKIEITHQTGDKHFESAKKSYSEAGVKANLIPFIKDIAAAYGACDMVICRAGALTVSELCAAGLGAIFIPYPHAVDDHQTANANFMVKHEAAICIQQAALTESHLADIMRQYAKSQEKRLTMAKAAYELRNVKAAENIVKICQEVCL